MVRSWDVAQDLEPIEVRATFADARRILVEVLSGLGPDAWSHPTVLAGWDVRDIAIHLLGNDLGRLRRAWMGTAPYPDQAFEVLAARIEASNERWVAEGRRIPPDLLVAWLAMTGPRVDALFRATDPWAESLAVAWSGSGPSPAWLDIAREYTEHWVHAEQIRLAVGLPGQIGRRWLHPVIDAFLHALPRAYDQTDAQLDTVVEVEVTGDAGGRWAIRRRRDRWHLVAPSERPADATVTLSDADAWRLFAALPGAAALRRAIRRDGDPALTEPATRAIAVMTTAAD